MEKPTLKTSETHWGFHLQFISPFSFSTTKQNKKEREGNSNRVAR
uniref:Uncharacterized protein n=1 Tax=Rhizophora mucronata TaxID=61149 RepID=A0A2P2P004_RHIMU